MCAIRIGFVGTGAMGQCAHLRSFVNNPGCKVVAIAEIREHLAEKVADRYGVPRTYRDHKELLANENLDGIVASQPYQRHGILVPDLYAAGIPVLTEKPLARSVEAGERILATLRESGARHFIGYHKRSDPATMCAMREIERLKKSGELGPLRFVRIVMPPGDWAASGFTDLITTEEKIPDLEVDPPAADMDEETEKLYDSFVNYYIHQVNLMRHLMGGNYSVSYADPSGVVMTVHSESGVVGTIEMAPYHTTVDWQEEALAAFDKGFVRLELPPPLALNRPGKVTILRDPGGGKDAETVVPQLPWVDAMRRQSVNFVKAIEGESTPLCEVEEALEDLKIARDYIRALRE